MTDAGHWLEYARSDLAAAGTLAADPDHADMPEVLPADAVRAIAVAKAILEIIEEDMQAFSASEDEA